MLLLAFYVPGKSKEAVKKALFDIGVGKIGDYDNCSFEYLGTGQFRGNEKSKPHIGQPQVTEIVQEVKVEMVLDNHLKDQAVAVLKAVHPYEEPAYHFIQILT